MSLLIFQVVFLNLKNFHLTFKFFRHFAQRRVQARNDFIKYLNRRRFQTSFNLTDISTMNSGKIGQRKRKGGPDGPPFFRVARARRSDAGLAHHHADGLLDQRHVGDQRHFPRIAGVVDGARGKGSGFDRAGEGGGERGAGRGGSVEPGRGGDAAALGQERARTRCDVSESSGVAVGSG